MRNHKPGRTLALLLLIAAVAPLAQAMERVTLRNGFELDCVRREPAGDPIGIKVRLYFAAPSTSPGTNFLEVTPDTIVRVEQIVDVPKAPAPKTLAAIPAPAYLAPTRAELTEMISHAGITHNIDADLLASLVRAESAGQTHAVSRTGARGLMQLMPATAVELGVHDAFQPEQNINGGTAYLDGLLIRYHDNIALALAAYNAGPGAVDRYHGIPPYAETRAYVARVIREFNRRKQMTLITQARAAH